MADFSARSETLRNNERTKHFASVMTAWGNALVIAAFARISFHGGLELSSLSWLVVAATALWLSWRALTMLEAEDRDD
jgi:hypothetical protein